MTATDFAIEINDLVFEHAGKRILDGLCLRVRKNEIFGFIGPNGAGKSTTIKAILGLVFPRSGTVLLHGQNACQTVVRRQIGFLPEEANYYKFLTPVETLRFYGQLCGMDRETIKNRSDELLKLVGLTDTKNKLAGTFSKGMAQKLSLAHALLHDPQTLILDEPTSGLDPIARNDLRELLKELKGRGKTIFFSSHELSEVELLCDSVAMVRGGRVLLSGPTREVVSGEDQNLEKLFIHLMKESVS